MPAGCPAHTKYINEFNGAFPPTISWSFWIGLKNKKGDLFKSPAIERPYFGITT